tara:strand:+ start:2232 stop:2453 length:222 start_codon:yes stop_codon:yes gene_type:complete
MANLGRGCGSRRNFYICLGGAYFCRLGMFSFFGKGTRGDIITPQTTAASTNYPLVLKYDDLGASIMFVSGLSA